MRKTGICAPTGVRAAWKGGAGRLCGLLRKEALRPCGATAGMELSPERLAAVLLRTDLTHQLSIMRSWAGQLASHRMGDHRMGPGALAL